MRRLCVMTHHLTTPRCCFQSRRPLDDTLSEKYHHDDGKGGIHREVDLGDPRIIRAVRPSSLRHPKAISAGGSRVPRLRFRRESAKYRLTLTLDNGVEFAKHEILARALGIEIFFARPYHSNARALNENTNGLLRQYFPKGTDFTTLSHQEVAKAVSNLNNRPRKRLNYRTPNEVFACAALALQT